MRSSHPLTALAVTVAALLAAAPASAQYGRPPQDPRAIGERYHFEISGDFWNPSPLVGISSESLGIPGSDIDLVKDFGIQKRKFKQLNIVVRPAKKHKFRFDFTPIRYSAEDAVVNRRIVFNGIAYNIGLPVTMNFKWNAYHFSYEYDFVYREKGFVGFMLQAKYTDVEVDLDALIGHEYARARAPIPAIGGIGRFYPLRNLGITFEVSGISFPQSLSDKWEAKYVEYSLYGTYNFGNAGGVQIGYRNIDVNYQFDLDSGDFNLKGPYFGGVLRF
jgi:hypothetical protein